MAVPEIQCGEEACVHSVHSCTFVAHFDYITHEHKTLHWYISAESVNPTSKIKFNIEQYHLCTVYRGL